MKEFFLSPAWPHCWRPADCRRSGCCRPRRALEESYGMSPPACTQHTVGRLNTWTPPGPVYHLDTTWTYLSTFLLTDSYSTEEGPFPPFQFSLFFVLCSPTPLFLKSCCLILSYILFFYIVIKSLSFPPWFCTCLLTVLVKRFKQVRAQHLD